MQSGGDLYLQKGSYTYSLPNKSGTLKLGEDFTIQLDSGSSYNYDFANYNRVIITLIDFDDNGYADLTIEDGAPNGFHIDINLMEMGGVLLELFKVQNNYYVRAMLEQRSAQGTRELTQILDITNSSLDFEFVGASSSDICKFRVEGLY